MLRIEFYIVIHISKIEFHTFEKYDPPQWTVLKALDDVASGTMSIVSVEKTKRCSGHGEKVADTVAKGVITGLDKLGLTHTTWLRPSRVLMDWIKKPVVTPQLGKHLLEECSHTMEVVLPHSCFINHRFD